MAEPTAREETREARIAGAAVGLVAVFFPVLGAFAPKGLAPLFLVGGAAALFDPRVRARLRAGIARPTRGCAAAVGLGLLWLFAASLWAPAPTEALRLWLSLAVMAALGTALLAGALVLAPRERARASRIVAWGGVAFAAFFAVELATGGAITLSAVAAWNRFTPWVAAAPQPWNLLGQASSVFVLLVWPAALVLARRSRWATAAFLAASAAALAGQTMLASAVAFAAGLAAAGVVGRWGRRGAALVLVGLGLVNLALFVAAPALVARITAGELAPDLGPSWIERLYILDFTLARIAEHPAIGWGLDTARALGRAATDPLYGQAAIPLHPHNLWAQLWLETGAVGLALGAWLAWRALAAAASLSASPARAAAAGLAVAYLAIGNVSFGVWQNWWIGAGVAAAALMVAVTGAETEAPRSPSRRRDRRDRDA